MLVNQDWSPYLNSLNHISTKKKQGLEMLIKIPKNNSKKISDTPWIKCHDRAEPNHFPIRLG